MIGFLTKGGDKCIHLEAILAAYSLVVKLRWASSEITFEGQIPH